MAYCPHCGTTLTNKELTQILRAQQTEAQQKYEQHNKKQKKNKKKNNDRFMDMGEDIINGLTGA